MLRLRNVQRNPRNMRYCQEYRDAYESCANTMRDFPRRVGVSFARVGSPPYDVVGGESRVGGNGEANSNVGIRKCF